MDDTARSRPACDTATRALDAAERLVQTIGFNGFSYADIAAEIGIRKASLHHHFATKANLGSALLVRYCERFQAALDSIDEGDGGPFRKLKRYVKLYEDVLRNKRMCLCGMLAAEYDSLPEPMKVEIQRFFDLNEAWLAAVIEQGRRAKLLHSRGTPQEVARMVLSALEGAMLVARPYKDLTRFVAAATQVLNNLKSTST
jgi:TetR/AcrR family transcriptional repressor of nem operon